MSTTRARRALICGVSGQDGAYLARLLLSKGYEVFGSSRDAGLSRFSNLETIGVRQQVKTISLTTTDFRSAIQALKNVDPDEVYNLSGQSSVALSFEQPVETLESIAIGTLNLLEAIRFIGKPIRFYNAGSSECFGDTPEPADERTPFRPRSPYAVAKATAFWEVANYRDAYGLYACSGILFNHESPLRPARFVTRKVVQAAVRIATGSGERLRLGNLSIERDWGWAEEYVDAMWRMLQRDRADDYVICTGHTASLQDFVREAFAAVGLDWSEHVTTDDSLLRPSEIMVSRGNPARAAERLDWRPTRKMPDVVRALVASERESVTAA